MSVKRRLAMMIMVCVMVIGSLTGCGTSKTQETGEAQTESGSSAKTVIGVSSWVGYAPLFIAEEKGFFKDHGADVEIKTIESGADRRSALASNKIQGMCTTVDTHIITDAVGVDVVQVLALDTSCGGDGLVAKNEYQSIKDLAGKKIALDTTSGSSYFWFQTLIK